MLIVNNCSFNQSFAPVVFSPGPLPVSYSAIFEFDRVFEYVATCIFNIFYVCPDVILDDFFAIGIFALSDF